MSKLDELIKELCPNGVEYKTINEIVGVNRGKRLTKNQLSNDYKYEVYHGSKDTILGKYKNFNAPENTTIVVNTGGIGGVKFLKEKFWCSDGSFWLGHSKEIDDKYLYYSLSGKEEYFASMRRVGGVPTIDRSVVENYSIPVPPLEVQREIVRILDNFTELTAELIAELTAELTARKKQYEYYRDELLKFDNSINSKKLKEVTRISRGTRVTKSQLSSDMGYPVYQNALTPMGYHNEYNVLGGTTFVISAGAAGEIGFSDEDFWAADDCFVFNELNGVINKYIYHFLMTKKDYIKSRVRKASIPRLSREVIENLSITVPSLNIQKRIVDTLDNFEQICNDLNIGLPAEIEARQKQYEYYRDKLLSFE